MRLCTTTPPPFFGGVRHTASMALFTRTACGLNSEVPQYGSQDDGHFHVVGRRPHTATGAATERRPRKFDGLPPVNRLGSNRCGSGNAPTLSVELGGWRIPKGYSVVGEHLADARRTR